MGIALPCNAVGHENKQSFRRVLTNIFNYIII